jgi:hypothetical protein
VLFADRCDDGDVRLCERTKHRDFARMVRPDLDDCDVRIIWKGKQR